MAKGPRQRTSFRRRESGETDYRRRIKLLRSREMRRVHVELHGGPSVPAIFREFAESGVGEFGETALYLYRGRSTKCSEVNAPRGRHARARGAKTRRHGPGRPRLERGRAPRAPRRLTLPRPLSRLTIPTLLNTT